MEITTYLPVFPGFYDTVLEGNTDLELESINEAREALGLPPVDYDAVQWDYQGYRDRVSRGSCAWLAGELAPFGVSEIKFLKLSSPREYNFSNDIVHCEITFDPDVLRAYLHNNETELRRYLKDRFTPCSGFIPFYSEHLEVWIDQTEDFTVFDDFNHVGILYDFVCSNEEIEDIHIYEYCTEIVEALNYEQLTTKNDE